MQSQTFAEDQELGVILNPEQFVLTHAERGGTPWESEGRALEM